MEFMGDFLGRQGYLPHGYCFTWTPTLLWSMVTADAVVALSYFSIPAVIVAFLRRRPDVPYRWVAVLFSVFIFACGTTHVMDIWTIWTPDYGLHAVTKMFTAVVSVATAVGLWPLLPKILKIPSVKQLQDAISALESEVAKRKTAEEHLADTEQSLSATLDLIGAGFITTDADGRILRMNPVAERITGWQLTQAAQRRLADVFRVATGSDTDGRLFESIHALAGDHATEHSLCLESARGVRTMVSLTCALNRSEAGELRGLTMLIRDETQLKTAESAADRLAKIVESSTDAIVSMDLDGTIVSWNSAAQDLFGYAPNEAIGKSVLMLVPDDQAPEESIILGNLAGGLRVPPYDATRRHREGRSVSVSVTMSPIFDASNKIVGGSLIARDIAERERAQAALRESQTRLSYAMDVAHMGTWELNIDSGTFERSLRHDQCYGYTSLQPLWTLDTYYRAIHPDERDAVLKGWQDTVITAQRDWHGEFRVIWPDGSEHWLSAYAGVFKDDQRATRVLGVVADITERKLAEQAIVRAQRLESENRQMLEDRYALERDRREAAEALAESQRNANHAKTEFLATINHELRTPLNGILGMAELARSPDLDHTVRNSYINQIVISGKEMADLMTQVLDMTKIEAGRLQLEQVIFDLPGLMNGVRGLYGPIARARELDFVYDADPKLPRLVFGDPVRLRQILANFISNALKFTSNGSIRLSVKLVGANRFRFEVIDTGVGIDTDAQQRLFQPYVQADASTSRQYGGTGLGLYICRELAQLMQGMVGVSSTPGEGSRFWAEVELASVAQIDQGNASNEERPLADVSGLRILVVDDNIINREVVSTMLERANARVSQAEDGSKAVEQVRAASAPAQAFDLVLMDMRMPVMGGIEATRLIREMPHGQLLPIIAFTADTMSDDRDRVFEAGANAVLSKPIDKIKLFETIESAVANKVR